MLFLKKNTFAKSCIHKGWYRHCRQCFHYQWWSSSCHSVSEDALKKIQFKKPLAKIISYADAAQDPNGLPQLQWRQQKSAEKSGLTLQDMDLFEVNEAFAVVTLAFIKQLGLMRTKSMYMEVRWVWGHPLDVQEQCIVVTLLNALHKRMVVWFSCYL